MFQDIEATKQISYDQNCFIRVISFEFWAFTQVYIINLASSINLT